MLPKTLFVSMVLSLTMLNCPVLSLAVIPQASSEDDVTPEVVEGEPEIQLISGSDGQVSPRHGTRANFTLWDLVPTYFGEFFEIFVFFMELKWHYEVEDAIAEASERIDQHLPSDGAHHNNDNYLLDFAKHYFVNNNTPLWKFKA